MKIDVLYDVSSKYKFSIFAMSQDKVLFSYNENEIMNSACTLKVFIMLEYFKRIAKNEINGNEYIILKKEDYATGAGTVKFLSQGAKLKLKDLVELMIEISDHTAANMLIDFLGIENINTTIKEFGFEHTKLLSKFLVSYEYKVGIISAYDYVKFFYMLDTNQFFNREICELMKKILHKQKYKDFLGEGLQHSNCFIDIECKSGKIDGRIFQPAENSVVNDGGIIITTKGNYYIAFLSEIDGDLEDEIGEVKKIMQQVNQKIFKEFLEI